MGSGSLDFASAHCSRHGSKCSKACTCGCTWQCTLACVLDQGNSRSFVQDMPLDGLRTPREAGTGEKACGDASEAGDKPLDSTDDGQPLARPPAPGGHSGAD